jgi:hypothetical protein
MAKGFLIAITVAMISIVMILYLQNFSASQNTELRSIAQVLVSEKVSQTWSDIRDDIYRATNLLVYQDNRTAVFQDSLPATFSLSDFLHLYSLFLFNYYKTPELDISFVSPGGQQMNLSDIPPTIMILPYNIEYYYPDWSKRELFINAPAANFSAITGVNMLVNLSNAYLDCRPVNPSSSQDCDSVSPYSECKAGTTNRLYLNLSFSDYLGHYFNLPENCFDIDKHSTENLNVKNGSGNYFIKVLIGPLPNVINVQLQNTYINSTTAIILNTTDFYINYLAQLQVSAAGYNTSRTDKV